MACGAPGFVAAGWARNASNRRSTGIVPSANRIEPRPRCCVPAPGSFGSPYCLPARPLASHVPLCPSTLVLFLEICRFLPLHQKHGNFRLTQCTAPTSALALSRAPRVCPPASHPPTRSPRRCDRSWRAAAMCGLGRGEWRAIPTESRSALADANGR